MGLHSRYKKIEILQIRFPRHTDAATDHIPALTFKVYIHKKFRFFICFEIWAQAIIYRFLSAVFRLK